MQILIDENNVITSAVTVGGLPNGIIVDDMPSDCAYNPTKYKYIDGSFSINPDYTEEPLIPIDILKSDKIKESKIILADWLQNNPILYTDGNYYSVTEEKQALLNGNLASYERAKSMGVIYDLKWNATEQPCEPWSYTDLLTLSLNIAAYVAPKVSKQQLLEIQIRNCETIEDINAIVIDYDE